MVDLKTVDGGVAVPLADDFILPLDAATATFGILGKKGRGKTHTAAVVTEGLIRAGVPTTVLDPTGAWYGLRSSADGTAAGLPVVIFGGEHGDVGLTSDGGERIAEILVERRFPAVLDLSVLRKNERRRFAADFLETLYQKNRLAHHVVIDEADEVAPQRSFAGVERLLGAAEDTARRGRIRGLGVTMISQRPASLNKTVLSQVDALVVLGMTAPQDVAAVDDWVSSHSDPAEARLLKASLPSLPVGQAWVWSPEWLGVTRRVQVSRRTTFDSSSTPKAGARRVVPTEWARVDVAEIEQRLATAGDRGADTVSSLRARVRDLEQQLVEVRSRPSQTVSVEVPVFGSGEVDRLSSVVAELVGLGGALSAVAADVGSALSVAVEEQERGLEGRMAVGAAVSQTPAATVPAPAVSAAVANEFEGSVHLGKAEREILTVLAQHGARSTTQVALLTRRSHKSGGFRNSLSKLRSAGLIEGRGEVSATGAGKAALGTWERLPQQGSDLIRWWGMQLGKAERLILDYLAANPGRDVPVVEIAERTGYSATSGGFRNSLSRLRSLGLAQGRGALRISSQLVA